MTSLRYVTIATKPLIPTAWAQIKKEQSAAIANKATERARPICNHRRVEALNSECILLSTWEAAAKAAVAAKGLAAKGERECQEMKRSELKQLAKHLRKCKRDKAEQVCSWKPAKAPRTKDAGRPGTAQFTLPSILPRSGCNPLAAVAPPICIRIDSLAGGVDTFLLKMEAHHTIGDVKATIHALSGDHVLTLCLYFGNKTCEDHRTLAEYGIGDGCSLHLVYRLHGGTGGEPPNSRSISNFPLVSGGDCPAGASGGATAPGSRGGGADASDTPESQVPPLPSRTISDLGRGAPPPEGHFAAASEEERCVYVIKRGVKNTNHVYECRSCRCRITGNAQKIRVHITGENEGQTRIAACPNPNPAHKRDMVQKQAEISKKKRKMSVDSVETPMPQVAPATAGSAGASGSGRVHRQVSVGESWGKGAGLQSAVNMSIMRFLAACSIPANVTASPAFRQMVQSINEYGWVVRTPFKVPERHTFGLGGATFEATVNDAEEYKRSRLQHTRGLGNVLAADGLKKYKISSNNTVLVSMKAVFFISHSNMNGVIKLATVLCDDAVAAIDSCGGVDFVFMAVMDGACKKTLRLLEQRLPSLLTMRCATHGWSLLIGGLVPLFKEEMGLVTRVLKFVLNHGFVFDLFRLICEKTVRVDKLHK